MYRVDIIGSRKLNVTVLDSLIWYRVKEKFRKNGTIVSKFEGREIQTSW
jgi:hypothetical protein